MGPDWRQHRRLCALVVVTHGSQAGETVFYSREGKGDFHGQSESLTRDNERMETRMAVRPRPGARALFCPSPEATPVHCRSWLGY